MVNDNKRSPRATSEKTRGPEACNFSCSVLAQSTSGNRTQSWGVVSANRLLGITKKRNPREPVKNIPEIKIAGKMKFRKILFYRWDIFMFQENSGTNWVGTIRSWWFVQKSGKLTHHLRLVVEIPLFRTGIKIHPKVFSLGISEWTLVRTGPYLAGPVTELRPWRICVPVLKRYLGWWWGSERPRFVVDVGDLLGMKSYLMWCGDYESWTMKFSDPYFQQPGWLMESKAGFFSWLKC